MSDSGSVLVVGAGPAGLAAAAGLRRVGLEPTVIDRATALGSAWRTRYDSFRLHTVRWLSGLPGLAIPRACGPWVARDDFVAYLEAYAEQFGVRPRLGVDLLGLRRDGGGWRASTSDGELEADRVVLATGACTVPWWPTWPGSDASPIVLAHSSTYRRADPHAGQRVLVVGSGNSGTEIAVDLARRADVTVELAVRTPPNIVRRDSHGLPTQPLGIALRRAPPMIADPLGAALRTLTVPDLAAYGLPAPRKPFSGFLRTGTVPVLDHGFVAAVRAGRIVVRPGVAALDGGEVVHDDGSRSAPDAVIAATGYRPGLEQLLGPLGLLDARGLPTVGSRGGAPSAPGLHTVGITVLLSGLLREIALDTRRLVRSLA